MLRRRNTDRLMLKGRISVYKVIYELPFKQIREIYMSFEELHAWLKWRWLRNRIISYEKVA